jgi:glycosyltransferase involved in cell wall biosynthesis
MGRSIRPRPSGVGRHVTNLVSSLADALPARALTVFLTQDAPRTVNGAAREVRAPFPTPNEYARAFWEQTVVPVQAAKLAIDVYHSPNYILPLALNRPAVVTIHDLCFLRPDLHRLRSQVYLTALTALALRRARAVIAVSEWTRQSIETRFPTTAGRVELIYQGLDPHLERPSEGDLWDFRVRKDVDYSYVLFVGTLEPRKNLIRLLAAYERAVRQNDLPHHLVLIGSLGWQMRDFQARLRASPLNQRIHHLGFVPDQELRCWYTAADVFVYPSLEEGFGLPPLEAMACGTPVITSNCSALPEAVGDAARLVDPRDTHDLASAITEVLTDASLADRLARAGEERARRFTWSEAARRHASLYERVVSGGYP